MTTVRVAFNVDLLEHDSVVVLAARAGDQVVGGAVPNPQRRIRRHLQLLATRDTAANWAGCLALVDALLPGSILVGYDTTDSPCAARADGFATVGPLRVWLRDV